MCDSRPYLFICKTKPNKPLVIWFKIYNFKVSASKKLLNKYVDRIKVYSETPTYLFCYVLFWPFLFRRRANLRAPRMFNGNRNMCHIIRRLLYFYFRSFRLQLQMWFHLSALKWSIWQYPNWIQNNPPWYFRAFSVLNPRISTIFFNIDRVDLFPIKNVSYGKYFFNVSVIFFSFECFA